MQKFFCRVFWTAGVLARAPPYGAKTTYVPKALAGLKRLFSRVGPHLVRNKVAGR